MESLRGQLLIAGASLWDPNFRRSVVLIAHHDEEGAVGVVLNDRPMSPCREAIPAAELVGPAGGVALRRGPVEPQAAVVVADFEDPSVAEIIALDTIGFLPPEQVPSTGLGIRRARVFAGYSGWGPGQLEAEMGEESWIVEPAPPDDVFRRGPDAVVGRRAAAQGPAFDLIRLMPLDPSMN